MFFLEAQDTCDKIDNFMALQHKKLMESMKTEQLFEVNESFSKDIETRSGGATFTRV
jgi:hypothetical protein